ncbi:RNA polymerase sporulation sigma factor SigE [Turicibacter bilis]|uniref:RNA polymerase sigma factor n=2 Tax=Turicibacteraceae TaxID=2810281 RepID=A0A9Q9FFP5_9FIRM|nr:MULTISPECIES: RNA polymerase sporulation sigma factor SigE [Turicibacter]MBP3908720.1 RNA polymerase sporulation sigma factor SigE [Turicibacter sp.]MDY4816083.1 RNA polymerase sporulation sigma factor SigE [Turicibacter bilis]MEE0427714.1 RNA polymerase sporulation sigma factor SigE [Turicibacter sp.]UUF07221.1 RNA polymerase sporulation sigma factor SigE [Turicibacter bilis]UUF09718.1 RNA polymerase sporulation sigma factor SigE [Turicibacter bilis]
MMFFINWFERVFKRKKKYVNYIRGNETLPEPLSKDEEFRILTNFQAGDERARQTLIEHNLRLVVYIAKKFESSGVNLEDLISIGTLGLIKGVQTFKMDKNIKLATYASRCIENEILMHLRKTNRIRHEVSLDEPLNVDWDGNELLLSDILGTEENEVYKDIEEDVERQLVFDAINRLKRREREIMYMRFGLCGEDPLTQKEVAQKLDISQSYISRLEKKIIDKIRKEVLKTK